jgi:lipopolysaccharide/colanic/teichoic acid biosynthesis glycosyltransferase
MEAHQAISELDGMCTRESSAASAFARRTLDLVLALTALVALAPLLIAIAIAIRVESRGPVIFRQRRLGRDRAPFVVHKFRTMHADCDEGRHRDFVQELISGDPPLTEGDEKEPLYKLHGDDRVTRVGRFLRRLSLDELPQLWNVLRGQMSLSGPRPVLEYEAEVYPEWYDERFAVKPGMTGLWQVSGRNQRTYDEMVRLDIEYVRRQSIPLDLSILLRTVLVVASRRGVA